MFKKVYFEAKNDQEAEEIAVSLLKVSSDRIAVNFTEELENGLNRYEATIDVLLALEGKKYLQKILAELNIDAKMEVRTITGKPELYFTIASEENPLLIGKEGRTLEAIQTILRSLLQEFVDEKLVVSVDIGNYKENRKKQLETLAVKIAKEVSKTKITASLKPMNPFERRVIHTKLSDWKHIETESIGEGENRHLTIKYKA